MISARLLRISPLLALVALVGCSRLDPAAGAEPDGRLLDPQDVAGDVLADVVDDTADAGDDTEKDAPPDTEEDVAPPVCGNGEVESGEECDDGDLNSDEDPDACRLDCTLPFCGDGVADGDEECDDGNDAAFDGCSACRFPADPCTQCLANQACGGPEDACVALPDGRYCAPGCRADDDCPEGTACTAVGGGRVCIPPEGVCVGCYDPDGDRYGIGSECLGPDCAPQNAAINPGATEICDDVDNNCNNENDEVCPPDLLVNGEVVTLSGDQLFDRVEVWYGGILQIEAFDGEPGEPDSGGGTGCLMIDARIVRVQADGTVSGVGAGGGGLGTGTETGFGRGLQNTGPGGGGYGGAGGSGPDTRGGVAFGTESGRDIAMGSNGGRFVIAETGIGAACDALRDFITLGGIGGACVSFAAPDVIVDGTITMNGAEGGDALTGSTLGPVDGAGGGSGGGIFISATRVTIGARAVLSAIGGRGGLGGRYRPPGGGGGENDECIGNGGGGGGGGRIKIFADIPRVEGRLRAEGGAGGTGPQSNASAGRAGTTIVIDVP